MTRWTIRLPTSEEIERIDFDLSLTWGDFRSSLFDVLVPTAVPDYPPPHLRTRLRSLFAQRTVSVRSKLLTDELYNLLASLTGWQPALVVIKRRKEKKR